MHKISFEQFKEKAIQVHGEQYIYDPDSYKTTKQKMWMVHTSCGHRFQQCPHNHLRGQGCPLCGKEQARVSRKYKWEHFIKEVEKRFGNAYEFPYIENEYENSHSKITVKCLDCGNIFKKTACDILTSSHGGCKCKKLPQKHTKRPKEEKVAKKTNPRKQPIDDIKKKLSETFPTIEIDYDTYSAVCKPVKCKCKKCGKEFWRNPNTFFGNKKLAPCPRCRYGNEFVMRDMEDFLIAAQKKHGDKYDYSEFVYTNAVTKGKVICHEKDKFGIEHGEFLVTPHAHAGSMASGCPKCSNKHRHTVEEWKKEAEYKHPNKYDYSLVTEYNGAKQKMPIICHEKDRFGTEHGLFYITSNSLLTGQGCPKCSSSHGEMAIKNMLDTNGFNYTWQYKSDWLGRLSLDFYLPDYKIAIECQGYQHYRPIKYWGGEESFKRIVARDKKKHKLCKDNGVILIYYSDAYEGEGVIRTLEELLKEIQNTICILDKSKQQV